MSTLLLLLLLLAAAVVALRLLVCCSVHVSAYKNNLLTCSATSRVHQKTLAIALACSSCIRSSIMVYTALKICLLLPIVCQAFLHSGTATTPKALQHSSIAQRRAHPYSTAPLQAGSAEQSATSKFDDFLLRETPHECVQLLKDETVQIDAERAKDLLTQVSCSNVDVRLR
jgi:hypothetical protein